MSNNLYKSLITPALVKSKYTIKTEEDNTEKFKKYIDYFNINYTFNGIVITVLYDKKTYSAFSDPIFIEKFNELLTKAGFKNPVISENLTSYQLNCDV